MIFTKLRRRQSSSLPRSTSNPPTYVHHASTPPDWPTTPTQATPDVYITSPAEEDGLQTSVCVHRAVEHEPKRSKKHEDRRTSTPLAAPVPPQVNEQSPPTFQRMPTQTADVIMPKKPSELVREGSTKWSFSNQQGKNPQEPVEPVMEAPDVEPPTGGHVQWEGGHQLTRVSSSRDSPDEPTAEALVVPKRKDTLRNRASKVFRSFTGRDGLAFGSSNLDKQESRTSGSQQKRRNTLSDGSRPFSIWAKAAPTQPLPVTAVDDSAITSPKTSVEGRRRSSTIALGEGDNRPTSPPLPPLPVPQGDIAKELPAKPSTPPASETTTSPLEPPLEIGESVAEASKTANVRNKRGKNTFSHLFSLKSGEKHLRSPPPAKQDDAPVPPVPTIPRELAKAVADPDTPQASQPPTFAASPGSTVAATPKSTKSKRFLRHRRRATIGSISQLPSDITSSVPVDTPKTPTSLRSRPFSIIDMRKGFSMRSLGKSKGKLVSAEMNPVTPPPLPLKTEGELPETIMQRHKSRPPPLQSPRPVAESERTTALGTVTSIVTTPRAVAFGEVADAVETALSSPTESEGPTTPAYGTLAIATPALAPAIELDGERKQAEESSPELSFTPATSEDGEQSSHRPSAASESTLTNGDPLFDAFDRPSSLGNLELQLHEPSTKTSTLDAHLRLDSLRFDDFSFNTNIF